MLVRDAELIKALTGETEHAAFLELREAWYDRSSKNVGWGKAGVVGGD